MTRFQYDFSFLSALLDHWRPETHTFHFTVGEMTVTLQDTSLLMGLLCEGEPLRAADISANWCTEFLTRFMNVPRNDRAPACTRSSRTLTDPPCLGCSSLAYVPLPHISLRF
jgi:hypothetical protein